MKRLILVLVLLPVIAYGAEAQNSRTELELTLKATTAEKDKYLARYNWGMMMSEEAGRMLPDLIQREQALMGALKQMEVKEQKPESEKK